MTTPTPDIMPALASVVTAAPEATEPTAPVPEQWLTQVGTLLQELDAVAPGAINGAETELIRRRLGIISSLFTAMQCKHAATAGHALRVALTCSAWAQRTGLDERQRDLLEIAALLHDVGVIGIPDRVLLKPAALDRDEAALVGQSRAMTQEILRRSGASADILAIVKNVPTHFDGKNAPPGSAGLDLPVGARMISIAEAFDAMTTEHVYRGAMSQERALAELYRCAGSQFDPQLVEQFVALHASDTSQLHEEVATRWLYMLDPELVGSYWQLNTVPSSIGHAAAGLFQMKLLENMYDGVVFIDAQGRISAWNRGAERLTGIAGASVLQRYWHRDIFAMADEHNQPVSDAECPVLTALRSGVQSVRRFTIWGRNGRSTPVDTHTMPVIGDDGNTQGAILLLHDASPEISLEQRCQSLQEKSTRDPLTQVANRAEFDRVQELFIEAHQQQHVACSLIMCDLDLFKRVNDTFGHQVGDDAIKSLAALLKGAARPGDLVARYGGEEFVMLCADCVNAEGARRAEKIRLSLSQMPQAKMRGETITASFGVTEVQPGDTAETMLRRADRALLMAKAKGRNMVVQQGTGSGASEPARTTLWPFRGADPTVLLERTLFTSVPMSMAVEKLRGFVADHDAEILSAEGGDVRLEVTDRPQNYLRRLTDRPVVFRVELAMTEERGSKTDGKGEPCGGAFVRTKIRFTLSSKQGRDRRRNDVLNRSRQILASFRSYLIATEENEADLPLADTPAQAKRRKMPWGKGKS